MVAVEATLEAEEILRRVPQSVLLVSAIALP